MNDSHNSPPLTLKCLYEFMIVAMAKVEDQDVNILSSFLFLGMLNEFANLDQEYRRIMINFKIHSL